MRVKVEKAEGGQATNQKDSIEMGSVRSGTIIIDGQSFPTAAGLIRQALLFNIGQISMTLSSMNFEGESAEERAVYVDKRRDAFHILELLDGVIHPTSPGSAPAFGVNINGHDLTKDEVTVLRQSLLVSKNYQVREKINLETITKMVSYMLDGKEVTDNPPVAKSA